MRNDFRNSAGLRSAQSTLFIPAEAAGTAAATAPVATASPDMTVGSGVSAGPVTWFPLRRRTRARATPDEIRIEIVRKSIHLLIGLTPLLASLNRPVTMVLLASGTAVYAAFETCRRHGIQIPVVSRLTSAAARRRDSGKFVLGPITLGIGALLALVVFDEPAASVGIYTLAFGDSLSSFVGKTVGRWTLPLTRGKSVEGSLACFSVTLAAAWAVTGRFLPSFVVAAVSTIAEALPLKDWDNIVLPLVAGAVASFVYF